MSDTALAVPDTAVLLARIRALEAENVRLRDQLARAGGPVRRKNPHTAYDSRRRALIAAGQWAPFVPAGPVRDHIRQVIDAAGFSHAQFAAAAGVDARTIRKILGPAQIRVKTEVAARICQVNPALVPVHGWVPAAGACRRLRALAVGGWSASVLAERLSLGVTAVQLIREGDQQVVAAATARKVRELYDEIWDTEPPAGTRSERISRGRTRGYARKAQWPPPMAWDDDTIDDPDASPGEWQRPRGSRYRKGVLVAEAAELASFGLGREEAAARLGVNRRTLEKAIQRAAQAETEQAG